MQEMSDYEAILTCPMQVNEAYADTVGDYLLELAARVWSEGEGFSGKRPFGDSGWEYAIYRALWENSFYATQYETFDDVPSREHRTADELVTEALQHAQIVLR